MKYHLDGAIELVSVITLEDVKKFLSEIGYLWDGNFLKADGYLNKNDIRWLVSSYKEGQEFIVKPYEEYILIDANFVDTEFELNERKRFYFNLWEFAIADAVICEDRVETCFIESFDEEWMIYLLNNKKDYCRDLESAYNYKIKSLINESEEKVSKYLERVKAELSEELTYYGNIKELINKHSNRVRGI